MLKIVTKITEAGASFFGVLLYSGKKAKKVKRKLAQKKIIKSTSEN